MYFTPVVVDKVIAKFRKCLTSNGCLIVSVTETSSVLFSDFKAENSTDFIFYRKTNLNTNTSPKEKNNLITKKMNRLKKKCQYQGEKGKTKAERPEMYYSPK